MSSLTDQTPASRGVVAHETHQPSDTSADDSNGHTQASDTSPDETTPDPPDVEVMALLHELNDGRRTPESVGRSDRLRCVRYLGDQGYAADEIARLMRVSLRTVRRDRLTLRSQGALKPDLKLGDQLVGEYHHLVLASIQRLTRVANDRDVPSQTRLWAEQAITRTYHRFLDTAWKLDYFPSAKARVGHMLETNPEHQRRERERFRALLATWNNALPSFPPVPPNGRGRRPAPPRPPQAAQGRHDVGKNRTRADA